MAGMGPVDLAEAIGRSRYRGRPAWLVLDGLPSAIVGASPRMIDAYRPAPMEVADAIFHFSGPRMSADAVIAELVGRSSAPTRMTVVSSDHGVQRTARRRRCKVMESSLFLGHLVHDARHGVPRDALGGKPTGLLSRAQVEAWLRYFGVEPATDPSHTTPATPSLPPLRVTTHGPAPRPPRKARP